MDSTLPKSGSHKPLAGMVVILFLALFVGGWLYVDSVRAGLEKRIDAVSSELQAAKLQAQKDAQAGEDARLAAPAPNDGWRTVVSAGGQYQIDLPPGTRLSESDGFAYVMVDPPSETEQLPLMAIQIAPASEKDKFKDQGGVLVEAGKTVYWLYLWENLEWEPFDRAAASFKVL